MEALTETGFSMEGRVPRALDAPEQEARGSSELRRQALLKAALAEYTGGHGPTVATLEAAGELQRLMLRAMLVSSII